MTSIKAQCAYFSAIPAIAQTNFRRMAGTNALPIVPRCILGMIVNLTSYPAGCAVVPKQFRDAYKQRERGFAVDILEDRDPFV